MRSAGADDDGRDAFDLYDNMFPVRGRHDFGGRNADFGSGRAGHSHQGQDVFARCGTPLVAARGGRVKFKQYHAAAGNYLVIDGAGTDEDYVYMHLAEAVPLLPRRPRLHRPADRRGGRHGQRPRLPPPLRALARTGLVRRREALRPAAVAARLGRLVLGAPALELAALAVRQQAVDAVVGGQEQRPSAPTAIRKLPKSKSLASAMPSHSVATNPPISDPTTPSTTVSTMPMRWLPGFSIRANRPTKRPHRTQVRMPTRQS